MSLINFVWCNMNNITIPNALGTEKNIVYYVISFREGWYGFRNNSVVIRSIGSHSVKLTVSRVITGYNKSWDFSENVDTGKSYPKIKSQSISFCWCLTVYTRNESNIFLVDRGTCTIVSTKKGRKTASLHVYFFGWYMYLDQLTIC